MASFTISPGTVTYTLPSYCCGSNIDAYVYDDMANVHYRALITALAPERIRVTSLNSSMTYTGYTRFHDFLVYLQGQLGSSFGAVLFTTGMPVPLPGSSATSITASVQTSSGYAPADHAALYETWINDGINIVGWEFQNEAENMSFGLGSAQWYDRVVNGGVTAEKMCNDWCMIRHRDIVPTYTTSIANKGKTGITKIIGAETAGLNNNAGYQYAKAFIDGATFTGANPKSPPSNIPYVDTVAGHSYGGGLFSDTQGALNSYFYDAGGDETAFLAEGGKARFVTPLRLLRAHLDANGGSSVKLAISEGGGLAPSNNLPNSLADIAQAISYCQIAGLYNMEYLLVWSLNRTDANSQEFFDIQDGSSPQNPTSQAQYLPNARYYAAKDMWFPYMKTAKRQVQVTTTVAPGSTPASANNNAVPRIQVCAGKALGDDNTLYVMVANIDKTTAEQVTISFGSAATSNIRGVRCPLTQTGVALTQLTPFGSGVTAFTTGSGGAPTLAAGEAIRFDIPVNASPAPGQVHLELGLVGGHRY